MFENFPGRRFYFILIVFLLFSCKNFHPPEKEGPLYFRPSTALPIHIINREKSDAVSLFLTMKNLYFPLYIEENVTIYIYKDQDSYQKAKLHSIDSQAEYHSKKKQIHIASGSSQEVWKHEFVHVFIHQLAPQIPYELHEAYAIILSLRDLTTPDCKNSKATIPVQWNQYRDELLDGKRIETKKHKLFYVYYLLYLWSEKKFFQTLHEAVAKKKPPELNIQDGNGLTWNKLQKGFDRWLRKRNFQSVPGC